MPLNASRSYGTQIENLIAELDVKPVTPRDSRKGFMPDYHIAHHFSTDKIIGDVVSDIRTGEGELTGKTFTFLGNQVALHEGAWQELVRISERIQSAPDYRDTISLETILNVLFEWIKEKYKEETQEKPLEFLSQRCEAEIEDFEVWIPIAETHVEGEFEFGNVVFKEITGAMIDRWEKEITAALPEHKGWPEFFGRWRNDMQGLCAATMKLHAESQRAYEVGNREAERAIALLRCLSSFNFFPRFTSYSAPYGQFPVPSYFRFLTRDGMFAKDSSGARSLTLRECQLTRKYIDDLEKRGLGHLDKLLKNEKRSNFEEDLLSALLLYSRSSLQEAAADKLTYILAPLEFLLLDGSVDPESLGECLALLNAEDLRTRKNIVENTEQIYRLRSRLIRGETTQDELAILQEFMSTACMFFINILPNAYKFSDRAAFIKQIRNWKLSGGLKGAI